MKRQDCILTLIALWAVALLWPAAGWAQDVASHRFKVGEFRVLPNDVSAFISPVYDLNGEACALLKVTAVPEFAFTSPLGVVSRRNEVGEIWLYLPKGSKSLTVKHPEWGVLRDYRFPKSLESRMTYALTLEPPQLSVVQRTDTVIVTETRVDTVNIRRRRPRLPFVCHILLTTSLIESGPSWGAMTAVMRRHGVFAHGETDLRATGNTVGACNREGRMGGVLPYYTGKARRSHYTVTAGLIHRLCRMVSLFEGAGYGRTAVTWELAGSEGGGYVLNKDLTCSGWAVEAGCLLTFGRVDVAASATCVAGKQWQGTVGIGVRLGKP